MLDRMKGMKTAVNIMRLGINSGTLEGMGASPCRIGARRAKCTLRGIDIRSSCATTKHGLRRKLEGGGGKGDLNNQSKIIFRKLYCFAKNWRLLNFFCY